MEAKEEQCIALVKSEDLEEVAEARTALLAVAVEEATLEVHQENTTTIVIVTTFANQEEVGAHTIVVQTKAIPLEGMLDTVM